MGFPAEFGKHATAETEKGKPIAPQFTAKPQIVKSALRVEPRRVVSGTRLKG